ncbi:hypothetical protein KBB48_00575 [Candidatus Shapirobacteria bacterium]|nr:hypothetical protein [Candidatus Shapirobacteria bacterium]
MATTHENKSKITWSDPIVDLAVQGKLTTSVFSSLLRENKISAVNISHLAQENLLTPKQLVFWFNTYLDIPSDPRVAPPYCPISTIVEALLSNELVRQITPDDFGELVTIQQQLLEAGRYIYESIEYDALETRLHVIRVDKGFRTVAVIFEQMPKVRRAR